MRSDRQIAQEALKRGEDIRKQKSEKMRRILWICSIAACLLIAICLSVALSSASADVASR